MHKTPVSARLFFHLPFSHSAVSLASPSGLSCFHGNQGPKARYVSACTTMGWQTSKDASNRPRSLIRLFISLWVKGYRAHTIMYKTPPPTSTLPPLPHSSDRLQTQNAQSNLIVTINKTLYTSPIASSISVSP